MQTGGVPFTNDVAAEFEKAYSIFNAYGALAGDKTIISGCVQNGDQLSEGFVYVNGELFYFEGGYISEKIAVHENVIEKVFEDKSSKGLIYIRTLRFSNAIENVWNWSEFKRIDTMLSLMARLDNLEASQTITNAKLAIFTQGGVVFPWFKPIEDIPAGFEPVWDVAGKTIVGLDPNDVDFNEVGKLFGSKTHQLTKQELPNIQLSFELGKEKVGTGNQNGASSNPSNPTGFTKTFNLGGGNMAHNNVQPSIVAYYIEWVGLD